jgi:hypothetical protein
VSLARIGPKKLRRIQAAVDAEEQGVAVLRAVVGSHWPEYWVWHFVTADHRHGWYDSRTSEWAWYDARDEWCTSACAEFPDHDERAQAQMRRDQMERLKRRVDQADAVRDFAAQVRIAAADMRHHFRLPAEAVIVVAPPAAFVNHAREALRDDPTLVVSDERERRHG